MKVTKKESAQKRKTWERIIISEVGLGILMIIVTLIINLPSYVSMIGVLVTLDGLRRDRLNDEDDKLPVWGLIVIGMLLAFSVWIICDYINQLFMVIK